MHTQTTRKVELQGCPDNSNRSPSSFSMQYPKGKDQKSEPDRRAYSQLEHTAICLQNLMRQFNAEKGVSQYHVFCSSVPIVGFLSLLVIAVALPRIRCADLPLAQEYGLKKLAGMILGGLAAEVIVWRFVIWVAAAGLTALCEVDLAEVFKGNRVVDTKGLEITQTDLFKGGFI